MLEFVQRADAHSDVELITDKIGVTVRQHELHVDVREIREKFVHQRQHMEPPEYDRRRDGEIAARGEIFARCRALGIRDLLQNRARGHEIGFAGIGQRQPARGPDQQARLQLHFQIGHLAADRWQRHAELAARGGEASGLDRGHEDRHRFQPVHGISRFMRGSISFWLDYYAKQ